MYPGSIIEAAVGLLLVNELSYWSVRVSSSEKEKEGRKREVGLVRVRPGRHVPFLQVAETPHRKIINIESRTRKCNDLNSEASCLENWLKQKRRKR